MKIWLNDEGTAFSTNMLKIHIKGSIGIVCVLQRLAEGIGLINWTKLMQILKGTRIYRCKRNNDQKTVYASEC